MLFRRFLESFQSDNKALVKELFSKNLMSCLMNQAAQEDRYLHLAAVKTLKCIEQTVEKSPELLLPILQEILGKRGVFTFDQRTSSKTVEKLLQSVTSANVEAVMKLLRSYVESMPK